MNNKWVSQEERTIQIFNERSKLLRFFGHRNLAHIIRIQERQRETVNLLKACGYNSLSSLRILDVGCGNGNMLRQFLEWGAVPTHLAGIDLRLSSIKKAILLNPAIKVRCGSATDLPWPDNEFDIVCQHTLMSSILDSSMQIQVAKEMTRVLRKEGAILWYDLALNNPKNRAVRGITAREIKILFRHFKVYLRRITLVPFIAYHLPQTVLPILYPPLSALPILRTHYLGLFIKPSTE